MKKIRKKKIKKNNRPSLERNPQLKGTVLKTMIKKPKKPNSANRKICKIKLSNGKTILAHIPGEGHNIQEHSMVLVRGGRTKDLPGIKYRVIRGKYDLKGVEGRRQSRSLYGTSKSRSPA